MPDIDEELQAYWIERLLIGLRDPNKQWAGIMRYKFGDALREIDSNLPTLGNFQKHEKRSLITNSAIDGMMMIAGKVNKWDNLDYSRIKKLLKANVAVKGEVEMGEEGWSKIASSSRNLRRVDINFLIAHGRLPLAAYLNKINVTPDPRCKLCGEENETHRHAFYECKIVLPLFKLMNTLINKYERSTGKITYNAMISHSGIKTRKGNEVVSSYKHTIWQIRGMIYSEGRINNLTEEMENIFQWKLRDI
jgi:hypothetical protein